MPTTEKLFRYLKRTGWTQQFSGALVVFQRGGDYLNIYRDDPVEKALAQVAIIERRPEADVLRDVRRMK